MARHSRQLKRRMDIRHHDIPTKANRVLNLILIAMIIIVTRIWHLAVVQYDQKLEESRRPQRKTIIEPAVRATIRDRFNLPLAVNKIQYQAAILYSQLRDIPSISWEKGENGKKNKVFKRKEYIKKLAVLLADRLELDEELIEDLIHAKASYYSQVPFVIKDELTEKEYYSLKMLEKDWPGIYVRRLPQRYYPRGRTAADVIGYMGAINRQEYEKILHEMKALEQFIAEKERGEETESPPGIENSAHARKRLKDLEEKAYTIHAYVGKTGIEGRFEEQLRGFYGKKIFYSDSKGNFLRELPGSKPALSGHRLLLTISAELQEYAERLLAENEHIRIVRLSHLGEVKQTILALKHPWIKGGSITVMDPQTAEVLALASYPRFDPNDFIASGQANVNKAKKTRINRWFEDEAYLADVWDQIQPLERERYDDNQKQFYDEKRLLDWNGYLDFILPAGGNLRSAMDRLKTLQQAYEIQQEIDRLHTLFHSYSLYKIFNALYAEEGQIPHGALSKSDEKQQLDFILHAHQDALMALKRKLNPYFSLLPQNYDKVLFVDLCRLILDPSRFSPELIQEIGDQTVSAYREVASSFVTLMSLVKSLSKELYHDTDFKKWRRQEEKDFLKQKRIEEKKLKIYPKPYLDYLDQKERQSFSDFWGAYKWELLAAFLLGQDACKRIDSNAFVLLTPYLNYFTNWHKELRQGAHQAVEWKKAYLDLQQNISLISPVLVKLYLQTIRPYSELNRPLFGRYRYIRHHQNPTEKDLALAFYPVYGFGYGRSYAYRQSSIQGSIFKLVTAYEALIQKFKKLDRKNVTFTELNPLVIIDKVYQQNNVSYVGYTQDGKPIPQLYKGGRLPRSLAHRNNGEVDLIKALGVSSNPYFSLLAGECLDDPEDLTRAASLFAYGCRTGIDLPSEIAGQVPCDLKTNRTGLYAMAIGQHSLVVTPLQTAVMLAAIANGGKILKPKIVNLTAGRQPARGEDPIACLPSFRYQENLSTMGIDFPLFTTVLPQDQKSLVKTIPTEVKREIFLPQTIRHILLQGLQAAVHKTHEESLASLTRLYRQQPEAIRSYIELKNQLLGKTSTSESIENIDLDLKEGTNLYTHVWFGSISFKEEKKGKTLFVFKDDFGQPELVIVVYLHYGGYGKEAAPLAAQIVEKWRELKKKYARQL